MTANRLASIAALSVALTTALLPVARELGGGRWLIVGVLVVGALAESVRNIVAERAVKQEQIEQTAAIDSERERALHVEALACLRIKPVRFKEAQLFDDLGVSWSALAASASDGKAPYVPRQSDEALAEALGKHDFVIVSGPSKSGKSRTAAEIGQRLFPTSQVLVLERPSRAPQALARLAEIGQRLIAANTSVVLWLDDIEAFLRSGALTPHTLRQLRGWNCDLHLIGTIRDRELATFVDPVAAHTNDLEAAEDARATLERAQIVRIAGRLTSEELQLARDAYPSLNLDAELGVHLISGPRLIQRLKAGEEACPEGVAIASAVIDWKRAGKVSGLDRATLADAFRPYLLELRPRTAITPADVERGIEWACQEVAPSIALSFMSADGNSVTPFDYVVAYFDGEVSEDEGVRNVPEFTWTMLLDRVTPDEATSVGWSAGDRGLFEVAQQAFTKALTAADPEVADRAQLELGHAFRQGGNDVAAVDAYRAAAERTTPEVRAGALYAIALTTEISGDEATAEMCYRDAMRAAPDSSSAARSAVNLGLILRRRAVGGRRSRAGNAMMLRDPRGELSPEAEALEAEAKSLFERAILSDTLDAQQNGTNALGVLFAAYGQDDNAIKAYEQGIDLGDLNASANFARTLLRRQRFGEVEAALEPLVSSQRPWARARGLIIQSQLEFARGKAGKVEGLLRQAAELTEAADDSSEARMRLGALLARDPDRHSEAIDLFEQVWADDLGEMSFQAAAQLGTIYTEDSAHAEAIPWWTKASHAEDVELASMASFMLAAGLDRTDNAAEAETTFRHILTSWPGSPAAAKSAVNLALLLRGRLPHASAHDGGVTFGQAGKEDAVAREINDEAERLLRAAVSSSDEEAQRNGAIALAVLLSERGRATEADAVSRSGMTTSEPPDEMTNSHREDRRGDEEP